MVDAGEEKAGDQIGKLGINVEIPFDTNKQDSNINKQDQLESTKKQMSDVREENERLKTILSKIVKDYQSLQTHFFDIVNQEQDKKPRDKSPKDFDVEETELVSLSLGTGSNGHKIEEKTSARSKSKEHDQLKDTLTLGLDMKFEEHSNAPNEPVFSNPSPKDTFEEPKEEEALDTWPPSKIMKNLRNGDDEASEQVHAKRARVSVRARCDAPTMNDGCQWRKYGQKIAKGNPCPRAYYRCTVAPGCPVRKQVQRCAEDMSILITTYEGNHNHPLPVSATTIASTTSAAASMLTSGSSTSRSPFASAFPGLNFNLPDCAPRPGQHYLPNLSSLSSNPSHTTITLDLTATPHSQPSQPNRFSSLSSNFISNSRYSAANLNFSSSSSESTAFPSSWSSGFLSYGAQPYRSYLQKDSTATVAASATTQHVLTDTIARAITSDPSFRSALVAAITSYVGADGARGGSSSTAHVGETFASPAAMNGDGCGSGYLSRSESLSLDQRRTDSMILLPPPAFSGIRSASASPVGNRENDG